VLEGSVDSQYGIGDPEWDLQNDRGIDAGTNLKTTTGWYENGNGSDLYGFSALPGGLLLNYKLPGKRDDLLFDRGFFDLKGYQGDWLSSTECYGMMTWWHSLYDGTFVDHHFYYKDWGLSVRCLRDE
jgi:uncharacterized protein (TIGR02145 family)